MPYGQPSDLDSHRCFTFAALTADHSHSELMGFEHGGDILTWCRPMPSSAYHHALDLLIEILHFTALRYLPRFDTTGSDMTSRPSYQVRYAHQAFLRYPATCTPRQHTDSEVSTEKCRGISSPLVFPDVFPFPCLSSVAFFIYRGKFLLGRLVVLMG